MPAVDLVINCYERTYREVLDPDYVARHVDQHEFEFALVTILVNNVDDVADAADRAARLAEARPGLRVEFVADHLAEAMRRTRYPARGMRRLPHFSDCVLVAVTMEGPPWVVYWDAECWLERPADWISPTLAYLEAHPDLLIGSPDNWHGVALREAHATDGDFALGYGISDVAVLARRADLSAPIYRKVAPASWRFPLSPVEAVFEQRLDAYMRRSGRMRATYLGATVTHPTPGGVNYPRDGLRERLRGSLQRRVSALTGRLSAHPALREWPRR